MNEEKAAMYQVIDKGRQLLQSISCPALESDVGDFADSWIQLNNKTDAELKR